MTPTTRIVLGIMLFAKWCIASQIWVVDSKVYFFDIDVNDERTARSLIASGANIDHDPWATSTDVIQPLASESTKTMVYSSAGGIASNPGLIDQFFQWFQNTWSYNTGSLVQVPDGRWWYMYESGNDDAGEKACLLKLSNDAVLHGKKNDILSCPSSGYGLCV